MLKRKLSTEKENLEAKRLALDKMIDNEINMASEQEQVTGTPDLQQTPLTGTNKDSLFDLLKQELNGVKDTLKTRLDGFKDDISTNMIIEISKKVAEQIKSELELLVNKKVAKLREDFESQIKKLENKFDEALRNKNKDTDMSLN